MSVTGERGRAGGGRRRSAWPWPTSSPACTPPSASSPRCATATAPGEGQHIDMALLDTQVAMLANLAPNYLVTGMRPRAWAMRTRTSCPTRPSPPPTATSILAAGNDGQFARFCEVAGRPDLARDPRYSTNAARVSNRGELEPILSELLAARKSADWISALEAATVPCGPDQRRRAGVLRSAGRPPRAAHGCARDGADGAVAPAPRGRLALPASAGARRPHRRGAGGSAGDVARGSRCAARERRALKKRGGRGSLPRPPRRTRRRGYCTV